MNLTIQKADVNSRFQDDWFGFYSHFMEIKSTAGKWNKCLCPLHTDSDPSFSFNSETGAFKCFGCKVSGDAFKFYGLLKGVSEFPEILEGIGREFGLNGSGSTTSGKSSKVSENSDTKKKSKIVAEYDYTDEKGSLLFQVVRIEPGPNGHKKTFRQRRPDGKGGFIWNMEGVQRVLYRLPEVLHADLVLMPEGEKDVDNLRKLGFTATTAAGGAEKWETQYNDSLAGRDVGLLPDSDEVGFKHVQKIANSLKDVARSIKVVELPDLPNKGDVSDWIAAGGKKEELEKIIAEAPEWEPEEDPEHEARKRFPRSSFPWGVLPSSIAESLKQLAWSCASSATSLPGAAIAVFASVIGSTVSVSPKRSWLEPLIFWFSDIRPSGEGKTPAARLLCRVLYECQAAADEAYKAEFDEWLAMSKKDRGQSPARPRGFFVTDLTLEGLREDHSGHGGKVCILDEVSAFLTSQNQYKAKGSDRESWLCLHDGQPARIVRTGKSVTLSGARISIFGGIQPAIWKRAFSSDDGQFLVDGTVFRFLPTYEGEAYFPLTAESWSDENREKWESLLKAAMRWSDRQQEAKEKKTLCLDQEAQQAFLDWRNGLVMTSGDLPAPVRGFIPKLVGYALRFAGVLYLMDVFSRDQEPGSILNVDDIQKGIKVSEFYLGHIIAAMEALTSENIPEVFEFTDQVIHLAKTLESMRSDIDSGWLAVGYILDRFNENCQREQAIKTAKAMGALLRRCRLTITGGVHDANGRRAVKCLVWDKKTDAFIETSLQHLQHLQKKEYSGSWDADIEKMKSAKSALESGDPDSLQTLQTLKNQSLQAETGIISGFADNADITDIIPKIEEKEKPPEFIEI
ncbi:MAG: DUF3987 domain-containing protein [Pseudomonadota bacterium]